MSNLDLLIMRYPHLECCKGNIIIAFELLEIAIKMVVNYWFVVMEEVLLMLNILWGS